MSVSDRVIAISVGAFAAVAYLVAGAGLATDYDYFGRLAAAFLAGHWWLDEAPSWLNELIACGDGRWCVVYPPLPAILAESEEDHNLTVFKQFIESLPDDPPQTS